MNSLFLLLLVIPISFAEDPNQLISAIVLFRHGARAPTDRLSNESFHEYFPNGLGELTDAGIQGSIQLGKFLRGRYIDTGFLKDPILPSQVYFRSRANSRCLMTASLVGSGMFSSAERPINPAVPVYSQEHDDYMLFSGSNCEPERKRVYETCGRYPEPNYKRFTEYQGFIYECLGLDKNSTLFPTGHSFSIADSLLNEYQNGLPMPKWFMDNKNEIYDDFVRVDNFIIGSGEYHNPEILRLKCGYLLHTILEDLKSSWETYSAHGHLDRKKFMAYSTQDWLMQAFMDAIGIRAAAIGSYSSPTYNSMIILELRKVNQLPVIKVFYRDPTRGINDVTSSIRGCKSHPECPLPSVLSCCPQYVTANPEKECYPSKAIR